MPKTKNRKAASVDEILREIVKTRKFDDLYSFCEAAYKENTIEKWIKYCILFFSKKEVFGIIKIYGSITLSSIAAKVYNDVFLNSIESEIEKIILNIFGESNSQHQRLCP